MNSRPASFFLPVLKRAAVTFPILCSIMVLLGVVYHFDDRYLQTGILDNIAIHISILLTWPLMFVPDLKGTRLDTSVFWWGLAVLLFIGWSFLIAFISLKLKARRVENRASKGRNLPLG